MEVCHWGRVWHLKALFFPSFLSHWLPAYSLKCELPTVMLPHHDSDEPLSLQYCKPPESLSFSQVPWSWCLSIETEEWLIQNQKQTKQTSRKCHLENKRSLTGGFWCWLFRFLCMFLIRERTNTVGHYHQLCSWVSHVCGNHRGSHTSGVQRISLTLGKSTFMIMVSPLPGNYRYLAWCVYRYQKSLERIGSLVGANLKEVRMKHKR